MSKHLIDFIGISKSYDSNLVLDDLNLYIRENEFLTLLGPSGCGKTTTLRLLGGFESPDKGQILFDGQDITALAANERKLNTVFQKYSLFPHMSIAENIAFGLKISKKSKAYIQDKIKYALKLVNLEGFENAFAVGACLEGDGVNGSALCSGLLGLPNRGESMIRNLHGYSSGNFGRESKVLCG